MTAKWLLESFEKYYGERYAGIFLDVMAEYLAGRPAEFHTAAFGVIVRRYSRSWGKAPGPTEMERHMDEILAAMPRPKALPEPRPEMTDADRERGMSAMAEIKRVLRGRKRPSAETVGETSPGRIDRCS